MEPRASTPWRVLESPAADEDEPRSAVTPPVAAAGPLRSAALPRVLVIGALAVVCAIAAFLLASSGGGGTVQVDGGSGFAAVGSRDGSAGPGGSGLGGELVVEIVGAVQQPGVYRLPAGSRVGDLLTAAGGYGPRVDTGRAEQTLHLAAALTDGVQIRVPSRDDVQTEPVGPGSATGGAPSPGTGSGSGSGAKVDLNHATQAELEALPGIGPATAQKILAARDEAPFASVDELRSRGILGEKTFAKLRDLVTVG